MSDPSQQTIDLVINSYPRIACLGDWPAWMEALEQAMNATLPEPA